MMYYIRLCGARYIRLVQDKDSHDPHKYSDNIHAMIKQLS